MIDSVVSKRASFNGSDGHSGTSDQPFRQIRQSLSLDKESIQMDTERSPIVILVRDSF